MADRIQIPVGIRQEYSYLFARHLSHLGLPLNLYYMFQFVITALAIKELREKVFLDLEELELSSFGYKKEDILKGLNKYQKIYYQNFFLLENLRDFEEKFKDKGPISDFEKKIKSAIVDTLKKLNLELPLINDYLLILRTLIIKNTDLEAISAPREEILNPTSVLGKESFHEKMMQKERSADQWKP